MEPTLAFQIAIQKFYFRVANRNGMDLTANKIFAFVFGSDLQQSFRNKSCESISSRPLRATAMYGKVDPNDSFFIRTFQHPICFDHS